MKPGSKVTMSSSITIRFAVEADVPLIHSFIRELAEYERLIDLGHDGRLGDAMLALGGAGARALARKGRRPVPGLRLADAHHLAVRVGLLLAGLLLVGFLGRSSRKLRQLAWERDQGIQLQSDERLSVSIFLTDWLKRKQPRLQAASHLRYTEQMAHVVKALGKTRLKKLTSS
jgi:hypothetical protein